MHDVEFKHFKSLMEASRRSFLNFLLSDTKALQITGYNLSGNGVKT